VIFQLQMNEMIKAAQIVLVDCRNVPRRSDMPICNVLDVAVIAVAGAPACIESMT
jgi:hypothetical protein